MAPKYLKDFRIHVALVLVEIICLSAFIVEIKRALSGIDLSWAYVFEWPFFAGYAIYMWRRLLNDERGPATVGHQPSEPRNDESLATYNEYLRHVHQKSTDDSSAP